MEKPELTPSQEEYFRTLEMLDSDGRLKDNIADAKVNLVRGLSRVRGFQPNND